MQTLKTILEHSKTIAILGLSPDSTKPSHQVAQYLQYKGYSILPIYPKGGEILGVKAYVSIKEAFEANVQIDILNVFRKSEALLEVAKEVLVLKTPPKCVWVQLGLANQAAKELLEKAGILYIEDSCIKIEHKRLFDDSNF